MRRIGGSLRRQVPQEHRDAEEGDSEENCQLVDDLLRSPALHVHRSAPAEGLREPRNSVLQENADREQDRDDGFDREENARHSRDIVCENSRPGNVSATLPRAVSSVVRAAGLHPVGHRFDPCTAHHVLQEERGLSTLRTYAEIFRRSVSVPSPVSDTGVRLWKTRVRRDDTHDAQLDHGNVPRPPSLASWQLDGERGSRQTVFSQEERRWRP